MQRDQNDKSDGVVLIVEDHRMMAQALALSLEGRGFECEIAELSSSDQICEQAAQVHADLVLLDLNLGDLDSLELIPGLRATGSHVLVVSGSNEEPQLAAALSLGTLGWVRKTQPFEQLLDAVVEAMRGRPMFPADRNEELSSIGRERLAAERERRTRVERLTTREKEVLKALSEGKTVQEIAEQLYVSVATVRSHVQAILTKLGVSTQLAAVAVSRQFLPPT